MSRYVAPDANPSNETLTALAVTQLGGFVQGDVSLTVQNNDGTVAIAVVAWMDAAPPDVAAVQASGLRVQPGGSAGFAVTVGGTGLAARNVRPRFYGCSIGGDQSGANTVVSETRS